MGNSSSTSTAVPDSPPQSYKKLLEAFDKDIAKTKKIKLPQRPPVIKTERAGFGGASYLVEKKQDRCVIS